MNPRARRHEDDHSTDLGHGRPPAGRRFPAVAVASMVLLGRAACASGPASVPSTASPAGAGATHAEIVISNFMFIAAAQTTVDKAVAQVTDVTGPAKLALTLEDIAAATYQSAVSAARARSSVKVAASIQAVEMQHAAILHFVLGQYPVPDAFTPLAGAGPPSDYRG